MQQPMRSQNEEKRSTALSHIVNLERMNLAGLHDQWRTLFGSEPPDCRHSVLVRRLAHRIQELIYGGPVAELKRQIEERRTALGLNDLALARDGRRKRCPDALFVGTRLVREWNGVRYEVTTTYDGYEFQGRTYRSLTAVAKVITGTQWNGKVFFGLRNPGRMKGTK